MIYDSKKFYIYFESHDPGEPDGVAEIRQETFDSLQPWAFDLGYGEDENVPEEIINLLFGPDFDEDGIIHGADMDMRPSELRSFDNKENVLVISQG